MTRVAKGASDQEAPSLLEMLFVACIYALVGWGLFAMGSCTVKAWNAAGAEKPSGGAQPTEASAGPSEAVFKAGAMTAVKERAVDPASVRFRDVVMVTQPSGAKAVCGRFNARNRAGGYNGYERFISAGIGKYTFVESDVADFETAWASICHR